jgi:hypothetical protein
MATMQTPTDPEAVMLIRLKRGRAKAAMDRIVKRFGVVSNEPEPGLDVLLDYLTNMVYAIELLLKVLADDWRIPGKSQFRHDVGAMYKEIFKQPHKSANLMATLQAAIISQKFIFGPANGLISLIPELEELWDELTAEFCRTRWGEVIEFKREVVAPPELIQYLQANLERFFRPKTYHGSPRKSREQRIAELECRIHALQSELERVKSGSEPREESGEEFHDGIHKEHQASLEAAASCFAENHLIRKGRFEFGTWTGSAVLPGMLDEWN